MASTAFARSEDELRPESSPEPEAGSGAANRWVRWLCAAPEVLAVAMAGFAVPLMIMLLAGRLVLPVAIPIALVGAVVAVLVLGTGPEPAERRTAVLTAVAAGIALAWFAVNRRFSAEDLYAHRDPTTYNLTGRWLMDHARLPIATHPELFGNPAGYTDSSAGFSNSSIGHVYAQGNHLLPVLLGSAGKLFGTAALLEVNVLVGAMALFVFFGLARRVVGPVWALVVMSTLAVSMPMLYVSRDTFSEPLALLYLMGGLLLLFRAMTYGRVRDYGLAGFVAASAAMARIDADASLLALIIVLTVVLARARVGERRRALRCVAAAVGCALVPAGLGWADVAWLASGYYHDERTHILLLVKAGGLLAMLGAVAVLVLWWPPVRSRLAAARWPQPAAAIAAVSIFVAFALLASRPLWMQGHGPLTLYLIQVQHEAGAAIDGTRTYSEQTVNWQALYFGWPTVLLAVIGYEVLVWRLFTRREYALLGVLIMGLAMSALYLWSPQITPDQPWAARRYVPVVMPMLLVAAASALRAISGRWGGLGRAMSGLGAVAMIAVPLAVTAPAFGVREEVPQLGQVQAICARVGSSGAVVELDHNSLWGYGQTLRSYCNVPSIGVLGAGPAQLAAIRAALLTQGRTLYVLAEDPTKVSLPDPTVPVVVFSRAATTRWPSTLQTTPRGSVTELVSIYLARVQPDGRVQALGR